MSQYTQRDCLFSQGELSNLINGYEHKIRHEIEHWERNKVLAVSETDLIVYLIDKYTLDAPRLLTEQKFIESEGETKIDVSLRFEYGYGSFNPQSVPGSYVTIAVPFEGDPDLFQYQASTYSLSPPRCRIKGNLVLITFQDVNLDSEQVRQDIDNITNQIANNLQWTRNDCEKWNNRVQSVAEEYIRSRKKRLLEQTQMLSALGLPIRKRSDPDISTVPVARKKRPATVPPTPSEAFKPEPEISDPDYNEILQTIDLLSRTIERSPSTFANMREEAIRDLLLVSLNGHYERSATGETFNSEGKTDILIRADGRNVFIAECKFWEGPKALRAAIDQLLGYLTWRDTKAALLVFSKNKDFTAVLNSVAKAVSEHPSFKRELRKISETHAQYLFRQKHDPDRELYLAVQSFNIPTGRL